VPIDGGIVHKSASVVCAICTVQNVYVFRLVMRMACWICVHLRNEQIFVLSYFFRNIFAPYCSLWLGWEELHGEPFVTRFMNKSRFLSYFSLYLPSSTRYGIGGYNEVGGCGGQCQCQSGITNVAKITKSYYEGHGGVILRECITVKCQENIYEIGMSLVVVQRQTARSMTGRQMVESSRGWLQRPETSDGR